MIGNNSLTHHIRVLVSANLYLNSEFYANHKLFKEKYDLNQNIFSSIKSVVSICLSNNAFEQNLAGTVFKMNECVKRDAILNCDIGNWSSMMCVIASSNALQRTIRTHYPLCGDKRIATVLNAYLTPNVSTGSSVAPIIDILWTRTSDSDINIFTLNHFFPLFITEGSDYVTKTEEKVKRQSLISKKFKN